MSSTQYATSNWLRTNITRVERKSIIGVQPQFVRFSERFQSGAGLNSLVCERYRISGKTPTWIGCFPVSTWRSGLTSWIIWPRASSWSSSAFQASTSALPVNGMKVTAIASSHHRNFRWRYFCPPSNVLRVAIKFTSRELAAETRSRYSAYTPSYNSARVRAATFLRNFWLVS